LIGSPTLINASFAVEVTLNVDAIDGCVALGCVVRVHNATQNTDSSLGLFDATVAMTLTVEAMPTHLLVLYVEPFVATPWGSYQAALGTVPDSGVPASSTPFEILSGTLNVSVNATGLHIQSSGVFLQGASFPALAQCFAAGRLLASTTINTASQALSLLCPGISSGQSLSFEVFDSAGRHDAVPLVAGSSDTFKRGDCNQDQSVNIADAVFMLNYLFSGGDQPVCQDACDMNDDGGLNIADAVYLLTYLFSGGPPPPAPFPSNGLGSDPTPDVSVRYSPPPFCNVCCTGRTPSNSLP
jgi:hypothetical protein